MNLQNDFINYVYATQRTHFLNISGYDVIRFKVLNNQGEWFRVKYFLIACIRASNMNSIHGLEK